jgi:spore maturation protein CgeB
MNALRILHVGPSLIGSTTVQRLKTLQDMGHQVTDINTEPSAEIVIYTPWLSRVQRRIFGHQDKVGANVRLLRAIQSERFDVLWIDKGLTIYANTLRRVREIQPGCRIVGYSPDDMMNPANQSGHFLEGLPLYHFFITTKSYHIKELAALGCPKILFVDNAYDPRIHHPMNVIEDDRQRFGGAVGFIGQWEPARAESIRKLAMAGISVRVWGMTWERMRHVPPALVLENRPLWDEDYARAICAFDIKLCFLRKCNRDQQTQRTMEIPACGGFMLAERTAEHQRLFKEGEEVEFFETDEEIIQKVHFYLEHSDKRRRIAQRGYERCIRDGYSNVGRLGSALETIMAAKSQAVESNLPSTSSISAEVAAVCKPGNQDKLRILYVGMLLKGSTTLQRAQALKDLGHRLTMVTTIKYTEFIANPSVISRIEWKLFGSLDHVGTNENILKVVRAEPFDVLWIDKTLLIKPATLRQVHKIQAGCRIVGYSPDDMMNPGNQTLRFLKGLPFYDHYIITKSYNVAELKKLGCPDVLFVDKSYDPHTHRPMPITAEQRRQLGGPVGFIGQWEPERAESLRILALAGIPVRVWGFTWERMKDVPPGLHLENKPLWADDYARAVCAFDITICFLRKANRDLQTSRTMEIPACGSFMLAERTAEHQRLFLEGEEAEYFSDDEELIRKVRYYLDHPEERRRIAKRGYERCLRDGYSNENRLRVALNTIIASKLNRNQAL